MVLAERASAENKPEYYKRAAARLTEIMDGARVLHDPGCARFPLLEGYDSRKAKEAEAAYLAKSSGFIVPEQLHAGMLAALAQMFKSSPALGELKARWLELLRRESQRAYSLQNVALGEER
jgi:hypothetical protein